MNVTRLGVKGELVRCSASRGVLTAEKEQRRCAGTETAIGATAYNKAFRRRSGRCSGPPASVPALPMKWP